MVRQSPSFLKCAASLSSIGVDIDEVLSKGLGTHLAPFSVVATTVINICLCDVWQLWGFKPCAACGHSVGEIAAAYACGIYTLNQALKIAVLLGGIAAKRTGAMLHTYVSAEAFADITRVSGLSLASVNSQTGEEMHITLCGSEVAVAAWLQKDGRAVQMRPKHPWHCPSYEELITESDKAALESVVPEGDRLCRFFSATAAREMETLDGHHWLAWLTKPVDFVGLLECMRLAGLPPSLAIVEIGAHPVLGGMLQRLTSESVSSMCRDTTSAEWMLQQRSKLIDSGSQALREIVSNLEIDIGAGPKKILMDVPFSAQGFASLHTTALATLLSPFFPNIKAFDMYRFPTLEKLLAGWSLCASPACATIPQRTGHEAAMVLSIGVVLPPAVSSCNDLWLALLDGTSAVRRCSGKKHMGGYLEAHAFSFMREASAFGIEASEAAVIDPQHVLAQVLAARCMEDAGDLAAEVLAQKERCGVYLGAWREPPREARRASAYQVLGTSLAAMASRVANFYDFQGPAITINTACSSGLVAVNMAMKDLRAGVVDYALVGSVNLLTDEALFDELASAHFLSPSGGCRTFSADADGYARSEGGVMVLLGRDDGERKCRALIRGSATNQNSHRRPMTGVDPIAQERVIHSACVDAGLVD
jgi:acyl transferase domain-containing protein